MRKEEQVYYEGKDKNDNEQCNRLEIGKNTFKKREQRKEKLGKESLNEPRKSSRYEMRQTDR